MRSKRASREAVPGSGWRHDRPTEGSTAYLSHESRATGPRDDDRMNGDMKMRLPQETYRRS